MGGRPGRHNERLGVMVDHAGHEVGVGVTDPLQSAVCSGAVQRFQSGEIRGWRRGVRGDGSGDGADRRASHREGTNHRAVEHRGTRRGERSDELC